MLQDLISAHLSNFMSFPIPLSFPIAWSIPNSLVHSQVHHVLSSHAALTPWKALILQSLAHLTATPDSVRQT